MRSFIYASTAMSVVTERQGRTGIAGMNLLRNEDPARPRFDGGPASEQPRCRLDIPLALPSERRDCRVAGPRVMVNRNTMRRGWPCSPAARVVPQPARSRIQGS